MKNILFLVDYYVEDASANGICCKNVAQEMLSQGYNVFVCSYRANNAPTVEVMDGISIYKTWSMPDKIKHKSIKEKLFFYIKWLLPFYKYPVTEIPERTEVIYNTAKSIILERNIDTIICVHLPIETLIAGKKLKSEFPNVKFCGYMLDSLSGGFKPRFFPEAYSTMRKLKWESVLLQDMDKVILMESSKKHHSQFKNKSPWLVKAEYLNVPLLTKNLSAQDTEQVNGKGIITVAFCGLLWEPNRNIRYLLSIIKKQKRDDVQYIFAGKTNCEQLFNGISNVHYLGVLSHEEVKDVLFKADILLNMGVTVKSAISGKIFEYMSYGKPIISTYSIDDEACIPYLKKYPLHLLLDERNIDLQFQVEKLNLFISKVYNQRISIEYVQQIFYSSTPKAMIEQIELFEQQ